MPPVAHITVHPTTSSKQAGTIISLSATDSTLGTGRWHTHKFEWTVNHTAAGGGSWNTLLVRDPRTGLTVNAAQKFRGFNYEFLADEAGTYIVTLTATDEIGQADSDSVTISVPASTRTAHFVDAVSGDDTNNGTQASPWKTLGHAISELVNTNDWQLNLRAGQEHPVSGSLTIHGASNIEIASYGAGTLPVVSLSGTMILDTDVENVYIHAIQMRSTVPLSETAPVCFSIGARHIVFADVRIEGSFVGNGFKEGFFFAAR